VAGDLQTLFDLDARLAREPGLLYVLGLDVRHERIR
jgi:hypothetical protein